ncbi:hypothetical protein N7456_009280 [Penicillium angulare]|uniref:Uncharacterized protein n=1 Tax=Penicillium angulare TaxID=116970 RepID=A0A9W9K544_9EURO|nr:hypothetical protein N7456_009280 [Penicillium angulare]
MAPLARDYEQLDTAASQLSHILLEAGICHVFYGGYAACLLGSNRVTKDINVITERHVASALNQIRQFKWSSEGQCWIFELGDIKASISTVMPNSGGEWQVPSPRSSRRLAITPSEVPDRMLRVKIDILHPSILLLTKLGAWDEARKSKDPIDNLRAKGHFGDIMAILRWISYEEDRINVAEFPGVPAKKLQRQLCRLFKDKPKTRPLLASCMSFRDFRAVITSSD